MEHLCGFVCGIAPPNLRVLLRGLLLGGLGRLMKHVRKKAARKAVLPEVDQKILEERQRIAEHIVSELRKAGYGCPLEDDSSARVEARKLTLTRHEVLACFDP